MHERPPQIVFRAEIDEKGKFHPEDAHLVRARLSRWAKRKVYVTVSVEPKRRTLNQNALMWSWHLKILAEYTGHTEEELHQYFKWKYLRKQILLPGGEEGETVGSTTELDTNQFTEYLEKIARDAALMGCEIPNHEMAGYTL